MQYVVTGRDGEDDEAPKRRAAARPAHIALGDKLAASGNMLVGVAIMANDQMIGSMLVVDFDTRDQLDDWLRTEPYVVGDVWRSVEIEECRVGPSFEKLFKRR